LHRTPLINGLFDYKAHSQLTNGLVNYTISLIGRREVTAQQPANEHQLIRSFFPSHVGSAAAHVPPPL
jgi:hypothetical protein